jgi:hypothetical protein
VPDNPELRVELEALSPEELETRCRRSGLSRRGTVVDQVLRQLQAVKRGVESHIKLPRYKVNNDHVHFSTAADEELLD